LWPGVSVGTIKAVIPWLRPACRKCGKNQVGVGAGHLAVPALASVDDPMIAVANAFGLQPGRIAAVSGFGQGKGKMLLSGDDALDIGLLFLGAVIGQRRNDREIADDRGFVLQIVVQP
jgi:hypothetical protein